MSEDTWWLTPKDRAYLEQMRRERGQSAPTAHEDSGRCRAYLLDYYPAPGWQ